MREVKKYKAEDGQLFDTNADHVMYEKYIGGQVTVQEVTMYKSFDDALFGTKEDCIEHELSQSVRAMLYHPERDLSATSLRAFVLRNIDDFDVLATAYEAEKDDKLLDDKTCSSHPLRDMDLLLNQPMSSLRPDEIIDLITSNIHLFKAYIAAKKEFLSN